MIKKSKIHKRRVTVTKRSLNRRRITTNKEQPQSPDERRIQMHEIDTAILQMYGAAALCDEG